MKQLIPLVCGLLFGVGLAMSGMTDTQVVLGFLDIFGNWNIALLLVMSGALAVTIPGYYLVLKRNKPLYDNGFSLPAKRDIDARLLVGAAIFGTGWGLYGYCPGPALAAMAYGNGQAVVFVVAMIIGMQLTRWLQD